VPGSGVLTGGRGAGVPPPGGAVKPPPKPVPLPPVPPVPQFLSCRLAGWCNLWRSCWCPWLRRRCGLTLGRIDQSRRYPA
jgi:hypothetical protein